MIFDKTLILLILFFTCTNAFSKKITLNDLIGRINHKELNIELTRPKGIIDNTQIRLKEGDNVSDIDFEIRFKINNPKISAYNYKLYHNQEKRKGIIESISQGDELNTVINYYISLNLGRKKHQLLKQLERLNKDKVKVLKRLVKKGLAKVTDYVKSVEQLEMGQVELKKQYTENQTIMTSINSLLGSDYKISDLSQNEKLISLSYIKSRLDLNTKKLDGLGVQLAKLERDRTDIESSIESERDNKVLDFISLSMNQTTDFNTTYPRYTPEDNEIKIQVSLDLPFFDSNMERADNSMDNYLKKRKAKQQYINSQASLASLKGTLDMLLKGVTQLKKSKSVKEAKKYLRIYSKRKSTSPLRLLALNEFLIDADLKLNEYKSELYIKFYMYMYEMGKLGIDNGKLTIKG